MKKSLFLRCLLLVFTFHCSTSLAKTGHSSKGKTPEQQHTAIIKSLEISEYQLKFGIQNICVVQGGYCCKNCTSLKRFWWQCHGEGFDVCA